MYLVDLVCTDGHLFEGWYDNRSAFTETRDAGELTCPVCDTHSVDQRPTFRGVLTKRGSSTPSRTERSAPKSPEGAEGASTPMTAGGEGGPPAMPLEMQKALSKLIKLVKAHTEDAGEKFAARAIAMHKGDEAEKPIHGTSTPEDRERLADEGVPFVGLPIPDIDQN